MSERKQTTSPPLSTVARGLEVLRAFRSEPTPLSNAELVKRTGVSKAAVSRLTSTLLQVGYLRRAVDGRQFEVAAGTLAVGHSFVSNSELLAIANPLLQTLANRMEVSAAIAVPNGSDMLYIAYRASVKISTLRYGVGSVLPMGMSAIGRAYLWSLPESERAPLIKLLARSAALGQWPVMESGIREAFEQLAEVGTCAVQGAFNRTTYAVALPVRVGRQGFRGESCRHNCGRCKGSHFHQNLTSRWQSKPRFARSPFLAACRPRPACWARHRGGSA